MGEGRDGFSFGMEAQQAVADGAEPHVAMPVDGQGLDVVILETAGLGGIVPVGSEVFQLSVEAVEPAALGADPKIPIGVFGNGPDVRVTQAERVVGVGLVGNDLAAVIAVQAILRTHPDETAAVLECGNDRTLG